MGDPRPVPWRVGDRQIRHAETLSIVFFSGIGEEERENKKKEGEKGEKGKEAKRDRERAGWRRGRRSTCLGRNGVGRLRVCRVCLLKGQITQVSRFTFPTEDMMVCPFNGHSCFIKYKSQ